MKLNKLVVFVSILSCWCCVAVFAQTANNNPNNSPRPYSDPQRYAAAMAEFADADRVSPPPQGAIVFVGSSSIRRWQTLETDMAPLTVLNRGFGGSNMRDAADHIQAAVLQYHPRAVVLYEGDNDLSSFGATPDMVLAAFQDFQQSLHATLPESHLYLLSIKPSLLRSQLWTVMEATNKGLASACANLSFCQYIDVATPMFSKDGGLSDSLFVADRLHMTPAGYKIWTDTVKPVLMSGEMAFETQVHSE